MFFDTHCHLDAHQFERDREAAFARAIAAGVTRFLNPAFDLASSRRAVALAESRDDVFAAVGVHPNDAQAALDEAGCLCDIFKLADSPRVVAIGEIGLDYHWDKSPRDAQKEVFVEQLSLARKLNVPVVIHCRNGSKPGDSNCWDDTLDILLAREWLNGRVLLHSFSGDEAQAQRGLAAGYLLGIGGPVTYPSAEHTRRIVRDSPIGQLVLETDAPYLPPQKQRGKRNEPSFVPQVGLKIAELRDMRLDALAEATTANALRFFGIAT